MDPIRRDRRIKQCYHEIANLTKPCCDGSAGAGPDACKRPPQYEGQRCCEARWCAFALVWAQKIWGQELEPVPEAERVARDLPFLHRTKGCIVEPHLRPICSLHACQIASLGFFLDEDRNRKYWSLRDELDRLEVKRAMAKGLDLVNLMIQLGGSDE